MFIADESESGTRERVLLAVSELGPVTASTIAQRMKLTPAAVRRHLEALATQGSIVEHEVVAVGGRGRGRPARSYVLSAKGHRPLTGDYREISAAALAFLARRDGEEAVTEFVREQITEAASRYAEPVHLAGDDVEARTHALAQQLSAEGFSATVRPVAVGPLQGLQLCQGHCPVLHVAEEFHQFCDVETAFFSKVLGVHVQRLATLADGHHVCTTFVPAGAVSDPGRRPTPLAPSQTIETTDETNEEQLG